MSRTDKKSRDKKSTKSTEAAADKPKRPAFVAPPKPGGNYPGAHGDAGGGGPKAQWANHMAKGRIFRHQGR
jgi:hypothetical protein